MGLSVYEVVVVALPSSAASAARVGGVGAVVAVPTVQRCHELVHRCLVRAGSSSSTSVGHPSSSLGREQDGVHGDDAVVAADGAAAAAVAAGVVVVAVARDAGEAVVQSGTRGWRRLQTWI